MKKSPILFILLIFTSLLSFTCTKPDYKPQLTNAIITGVDFRKCSCCGGLMITFSNNPAPYAADFSIIGELPSGSGINPNSDFPVYVKVKYTKSSAGCGNGVNISELHRS